MVAIGSIFCCGRKADNEVDDLHKNEKWGMVTDKDRKCQDVGCLILFVLFWVGMIVVGAVGLNEGEPKRLLYGNDYRGKTCGVDSSVADRKYTTYPRPNLDMLVNYGKTDPRDFQFYGICVSSCPKSLDVVCNENVPQEDPDYTQDNMRDCFNKNPSGSNVDCSKVKENCWVTPVDTSSVLFRCVPRYNITSNTKTECIWPDDVKDPKNPACVIVREDRDGIVERPAQENLLFKKLNSAQQVWGRYFGDLARTWWVIILCAVGIGLVMGFVWLTFLKHCTGVMVYTTITLTIALLIGLTTFLYYKAGVIDPSDVPGVNNLVNEPKSRSVDQKLDDEGSNETAFRVCAYIMTAVTIIALCLLIALRKSIRIAIDVIKLGSDALRAHPFLLVFPLTTVMAVLAFAVWWLFVSASLMSAGKISTKDFQDTVQDSIGKIGLNASAIDINPSDPNNKFTVVEEDDITRVLLAYHVFGGLWTAQFIIGVAVTTIAGVVAGWYFSRNENDIADLKVYEQPKHAILASLKRTLKYHLGSIAFGSFLIALIQFIRLIMAYIQRRTKNLQKTNRLVKALFCVIQCMLWCFQKCLEVVTRNAYIVIATSGVSFCAAGRRVISLIVSYFKTLAVVNMLAEILIFIGKLLVAGVCAFFCFAIVDNVERFQTGGEDEVSSVWLPALMTFIFAYVIATAFFIVYDISVDTILICYITDMDENYARSGSKSNSDKVAIHVKKSRVQSLKAKKREQLKKDGEIDDDEEDGSSSQAAEAYNQVQVINPRGAGAQ